MQDCRWASAQQTISESDFDGTDQRRDGGKVSLLPAIEFHWANGWPAGTFYGVSAAQSLDSSHAIYTPSSGIRDVDASLDLTYELARGGSAASRWFLPGCGAVAVHTFISHRNTGKWSGYLDTGRHRIPQDGGRFSA